MPVAPDSARPAQDEVKGSGAEDPVQLYFVASLFFRQRGIGRRRGGGAGREVAGGGAASSNVYAQALKAPAELARTSNSAMARTRFPQ